MIAPIPADRPMFNGNAVGSADQNMNLAPRILLRFTALPACGVMLFMSACSQPRDAVETAPPRPATEHQPHPQPAPRPTSPSVRGAEEIGRSRLGEPLHCTRIGSGPDRTLIVGGVHGDEPQSTAVAERLIELLRADPALAAGCEVAIVPAMNPDGLKQRRRQNAARVDLNRNFPAANWKSSHPSGRYHGGPSPTSEPETAAILRLVETFRPHRIVAIHTINGRRICNNFDGPAEPLAIAMSRHNGYPPKATIGYPTPGSFGSWAGCDLGIPIVTLEMPARSKAGECWRQNRDALLAAIRFNDGRRVALGAAR